MLSDQREPAAVTRGRGLIGKAAAGERAAIIYSLVESCRRHGKEPLAYLRDVLARLLAMTNQDDLTPLLPSNWQPPVPVIAQRVVANP